MTEAQGLRFDGTQYEYLCEVCDSHVLTSAKHCGQCNRCVNEFDHHCRWINNCVGQQNYRYFFRLICATFSLALMYTVTNAFVLQ